MRGGGCIINSNEQLCSLLQFMLGLNRRTIPVFDCLSQAKPLHCKNLFKSSWATGLKQTWLIYNTNPCKYLYYLYVKYLSNRSRNVGLSVLASSFKCLGIAKNCKVQLSHCSWASLAHLQSRSLLVSILPICKISKQSIRKCRLECVNKKVSTDG